MKSILSQRNQRRLIQIKKDELQAIYFDFVNEYKVAAENKCRVIYDKYFNKWKYICKTHNSIRSNTFELKQDAFEIMCRNTGIIKHNTGFFSGIKQIFLVLIGKK